MATFVLAMMQGAMTGIAVIAIIIARSARRYYLRQAAEFDWSHRERCGAPILFDEGGILVTTHCAMWAGHRPTRHLVDPHELQRAGLLAPPF